MSSIVPVVSFIHVGIENIGPAELVWRLVLALDAADGCKRGEPAVAMSARLATTAIREKTVVMSTSSDGDVAYREATAAPDSALPETTVVDSAADFLVADW